MALSRYEVPALEALVPRRELSQEEERQLIEDRRKLICHDLRSMNLPQLGNIDCLHSENSHMTELGFGPACASSGLSLRTRGIFGLQPESAIQYEPNSGFRPGPGGVARPNGTKWLWGLTEDNDWAVVSIDFVGEAGSKDRGRERATVIAIERCSLEQLLEITKTPAQCVWRKLSQQVKQYVADQYQAYQRALQLANVVDVENLVYDHLTSTL
jgi:hypothetical protein